jgi:hypothetical protein
MREIIRELDIKVDELTREHHGLKLRATQNTQNPLSSNL